MAVTLAVISFFVTAVGLVDTTGTCGVVDRNGFEIKAGWTNLTYIYHWMVEVHVKQKTKKGVQKGKCMGVAITEKWVLTAGTCVEKATL